jgi:hypothetical protein
VNIRVGLVLAGVLGAADLAVIALTDGKHPPMAVAAVDAALGLLTLVGVVLAWRGGQSWIKAVAATRLMSALSAAPALFASDVSTAVKGAASAAILLTIAAVVLLAPALRPGVEGAATDHRM